MPNYQNGKIYAIRSHETDEIYIGSTTQTLAQRMTKHRDSMKRWKDGRYSHTRSFEILKYPTCYIELLEEYPCNNKMELEKKEGEYIRKMECVNKIVAGRTNKQYYEDNKDEILEQKKQYYQEHKQEKKEYDKQYRLDNADKINQKHTCDCGGKYTTQNKSQHLKTKQHLSFISSSSVSSSS